MVCSEVMWILSDRLGVNDLNLMCSNGGFVKVEDKVDVLVSKKLISYIYPHHTYTGIRSFCHVWSCHCLVQAQGSAHLLRLMA